ncbi:hypothetical protein Dxin01_00126 [Deinococcus xinjiangensis]|uniref:Phage protein n=1 Tax=Deinococcus xinjiangensis TaxID=457454 RepID=A0ABP9V898_9DEIO
MGYDTTYKLAVLKKINGNFEDRDFDDYAEAANAISENFERVRNGESMRRWDHDADMCALSLKFPDEIFVLRGYSEEQTDIWRTAYRGGEAFEGSTVIYFEDIVIDDDTILGRVYLN